MPRLRFDVLANLLGQGWAVLIGLLFVPFFVRELGLERYALIALLPVATALVQVLDLGLGVTLNRELARQVATMPSSARSTTLTLLVVHLMVGAIVCTVALVAAPTVGPSWLKAPERFPLTEFNHAVLLLAVVITLQWPLSLFQNGLMGMGRQARVNALSALHATIANVGAAVLIFISDATLTTYFAWIAICAAIHSSVTGAVLWHALPPAHEPIGFSKATLARVWRFSGGAAGIGVTGAVLIHVDRLIASRLLSLEQFGYYGLATTIGRSVYLLIAPIFSAVFPRLSGLVARDNSAQLANIYSSASQLMAFAIAPPAAVIFWMGFEAAYAWLGSVTTAPTVAALAAALVLGSALNGFMNLPYALQLANGLTHIGLRINLLLLAIAVPSAYMLQAWLGAVGVAATWLVINAVYLAVGVPLTHRVAHVGSAVRWVFHDILPATAAAFIGVGLYHTALGSGATRVSAAALLAGALGVGYVCALLVTPAVRRETGKLLRTLRDAAPSSR